MKVTDVISGAKRSLIKAGFKVKKHSPEILVVVGVAGVVTSTVMACKATTKAGDILEEHKNQMNAIDQVVKMDRNDYTEEDHKKDTTIVYTQTAIKFVKLYSPSIMIGVLSLGCIIYSHNILTKRNAALAAAYATVDRGFKEYRGRVVERFGKELDQELRYNIKAQEFEKTDVDKKGNEKVVKETVNVADPNLYSDYARFFDDGCNGWSKDPEQNLTFLKCQQAYANEKLKAKGYLFLNDVYKMLGIPATKAGQIVGWIYDEKNPIVDNFVDFGLYDMNKPVVRDFVNGYERTILLDFNVDGNILEMM